METVEANEKLLAWASNKDLSAILKRVGQYVNMAEGSNNNIPDSPEWHALNTEQNRAREMADLLMEAFAISEAMREAAKPATERIKPVIALIPEGTGDLAGMQDRLADIVARFTRCSIRGEKYNREEGIWYRKVYGYEGDVRYFEFLYTTLRLHFVGALRPQIDAALSLAENCYVLHNAGFGWHEIAKMYGWTEKYDRWYSPEGELWTGETRILMRKWRTPYFSECKRRGEEPIKNISPEAFRLDAADGYMTRIRQRLQELEENRKLEAGSAVAIRVDDLEEFIREEMGTCIKCPACGKLSIRRWKCDQCGNTEGMEPPPAPLQECPKCKKAARGVCNDHRITGIRYKTRKFSEAGFAAGRRQANSADLGGQRTGSSSTRSIT